MSTMLLAATALASITTPTSARFECGATVVAVRFTQARATLRIGNRAYRLGQVLAADGARYSGLVGKRRIDFWAKGDGATLMIGNRSYPSCKLAELPIGTTQ